ncbi:MAG: hypothetical protein ACR2PZ_18955 [Pseudomonadales bacterium]
MWLRLRQIALVAAELAPVEEAITSVLGVDVCYRDPGVAHFGLENALFPIGNQLLEVVAPVQPNTAGGRYLSRRGGDGGYMVITQCDEHAPRRARVESLGVRIAHQFKTAEFLNMQLHPKDTGGTFFEIDEQLGDRAHAEDGPWEPAGPDWQQHRKTDRVSAILAAEIQGEQPQVLAQRWAEIAELEATDDANGRWQMSMANAVVRFVPIEDGRPEGLGAIDLACHDVQGVIESAVKAGLEVREQQLLLCGMRMNLIQR